MSPIDGQAVVKGALGAVYGAKRTLIMLTHQADIFKMMRSEAANANERMPIKPAKGI